MGTPEQIRKDFEDAAFNARFLSGVRRCSETDQFPFKVDCPTQEEFVAKDPAGSYVEDSLNPAWWAWQKATEAATARLAALEADARRKEEALRIIAEWTRYAMPHIYAMCDAALSQEPGGK